MSSRRLIRIEDLGAGFRRLHLECGHSLKTKRRTGHSAVGDYLTCAVCDTRSALKEVGINGNQALDGHVGRRRASDPAPLHCHLGPRKWGR